MIKETARVIAIEADCLWVETIRKSTCGSCAVQKACGHGLLNQLSHARPHYIRVLLQGRASAGFRIGQDVDIAIPERVLVLGSMLVYLLPLLMLLLGSALMTYWLGSDAASVLGAALGLAAGFACIKWHDARHRENPALQPTLLSDTATVTLCDMPKGG